MKFDYKKVFLLGFGFFAVSVTWSVYNSFVPILLNEFTQNAMIIGFIMTIDNYLALFIQPIVGSYSDKHDTKFGKRMPFLIIGMPIATVFLFLIPSYWNFLSLIAFLVLMNLAMSLFRAPVISLMPDITPLELRSKSNSIINIMGGVGAIIAYVVGAELWKKGSKYPFYMCGVLMIVSLVVLFFNINEKRDSIYVNTKEEKNKVIDEKSENITIFDRKSLIFLLSAICCYFIAYQGVETFFTMYGKEYLNVSVPSAAKSLFFISLSFLIFAYPAGIIGTRIGKKKTMIIGIIGIMISFFFIAFTRNLFVIRVFFVLCGFYWSLININSYPFVVQMASSSKTGTYTGYYSLVSSIAAIVSPPLLGLLIDILSYRCMFFYSALFFAVSLILILNVKTEGR